jgi:acylphosphatase
MLRRAEILVRGVVQGVYFRYNTKRKADDFNVKGRVSNRSDGSVEVICEGDEEDIARLVEWCNKGPQGAAVQRVDVTWRAHSGEFIDFRIAY